MNDVAIIDDVTMPSFGLAAAAGQGQHRTLADEAFQPIIIDPYRHAQADQPRRHVRSTKPLLEVTNTVASS